MEEHLEAYEGDEREHRNQKNELEHDSVLHDQVLEHFVEIALTVEAKTHPYLENQSYVSELVRNVHKLQMLVSDSPKQTHFKAVLS